MLKTTPCSSVLVTGAWLIKDFKHASGNCQLKVSPLSLAYNVLFYLDCLATI